MQKAQALAHWLATRRETHAAAPAHPWQCFLSQKTLKYYAYYSTPDRDAWPSLNYIRGGNYATTQALAPWKATRRETRVARRQVS